MAYKIQYTPQEVHRYPPLPQQKGSTAGTIWVLVLIAVTALCFSYYGIPDFLIPGDTEVTKSAAREMISLLKTGTPVKDAVTVFCKQIIDAAVV